MDFTQALRAAATTAGLSETAVADLLHTALPPSASVQNSHPPRPLPTSQEWFDFIDTHCSHTEKQAITDIVNAFSIKEEYPEESARLVMNATDKLERERVRRALEEPDGLFGGGDGGFSKRERKNAAKSEASRGAKCRCATCRKAINGNTSENRHLFIYHLKDDRDEDILKSIEFECLGKRDLTPLTLHVRQLRRDDWDYVVSLLEPARTAKWLRMTFTTSHDHFVDREIIYAMYKDWFGGEPQSNVVAPNEKTCGDAGTGDETNLQDEVNTRGQDNKTNEQYAPDQNILCKEKDTLATAVLKPQPPILNEHNFYVCLLKATTGTQLGPHEESTLLRGLKPRKQPLTLRCTQAKRNRAKLRAYQNAGVIDQPKTLFAQYMMMDPLFMVPAEHGSALRPLRGGRPKTKIGDGGGGLAAAEAKLDSKAHPGMQDTKARVDSVAQINPKPAKQANSTTTTAPTKLPPRRQIGNLMLDYTGEFWEDTANPGTSCRQLKKPSHLGRFTAFQGLPPISHRHMAARDAYQFALAKLIASETPPEGVKLPVIRTETEDYDDELHEDALNEDTFSTAK